MSQLTYNRGIIAWRTAEGLWFRERGPCVIDVKGAVHFAQLDSASASYNRLTGPSSIYNNGSVYYKNKLGLVHRTSGPAIIDADGNKTYFINGRYVPDEQFFLTYGVL